LPAVRQAADALVTPLSLSSDGYEDGESSVDAKVRRDGVHVGERRQRVALDDAPPPRRTIALRHRPLLARRPRLLGGDEQAFRVVDLNT